MSNQIRALGASLAAFPIFYVVAVLFGAPVFSHFWETATFAAVISLFTAIPLVLASDGDYNSLYRIAFLNDTRDLGKKQVALQRIAFGSLIGAWISCVVIPLDWDRWWQITRRCLLAKTGLNITPLRTWLFSAFLAIARAVLASLRHFATVVNCWGVSMANDREVASSLPLRHRLRLNPRPPLFLRGTNPRNPSLPPSFRLEPTAEAHLIQAKY
ncbi:hypothetical protein L596_021199 [Steinernema carpocapsae]|uniref:Uncharacterized protein n=1 Tax=Steinernema carpocapsae TaxID=34508 RepID=A0A4U5MX26_STECR|nr:hypothetical protein L596_021199 [Steinernema carpocapsae]